MHATSISAPEHNTTCIAGRCLILNFAPKVVNKILNFLISF